MSFDPTLLTRYFTNVSQATRDTVLREFEAAEVRGLPDASTLFTDVYHDVPRHLQEQWQQVQAHIAKYPDEYPYLRGKDH